MTIRHWIQKAMPPFIVTILSINLLLGCVSKENIEVPASQPIAHPRLAEMQSLSLQEKDNVTYFGKSRRYYKNGILIVVLSGEPYEIGFARGALFRDEIRDWIKYLLYLVKRNSLGTSYGENRLKERAKEVEEFIPPEYR